MISAADQGALLQLLIRMMGARRCIEVGVYTGYGTLGMAIALPDDGRVLACDVSDEYTRVGKPFWERAGVSHKVDLRLAPAAETLAHVLAEENGEGAFDLAFIDADKKNYITYYEQCLRLVRAGGLIVFDNTLWGGRVVTEDEASTTPDTRALRELNDLLLHDERVEIAMLSISDGVTFVRVL
jgi:caffeoyl-CoA O-methyltransferase